MDSVEDRAIVMLDVKDGAIVPVAKVVEVVQSPFPKQGQFVLIATDVDS